MVKICSSFLKNPILLSINKNICILHLPQINYNNFLSCMLPVMGRQDGGPNTRFSPKASPKDPDLKRQNKTVTYPREDIHRLSEELRLSGCCLSTIPLHRFTKGSLHRHSPLEPPPALGPPQVQQLIDSCIFQSPKRAASILPYLHDVHCMRCLHCHHLHIHTSSTIWSHHYEMLLLSLLSFTHHIIIHVGYIDTAHHQSEIVKTQFKVLHNP